ncbi:Hypothetical protein PBC10988_39940 [Planctomycetales bacterium 10988]|nr:Hypothetical protein PBC10988_39940 [Planctomycetales bacterium 10988]
MKWLAPFRRWQRNKSQQASAARITPSTPQRPIRRCRIEAMERREMLSADPLHFGAVYYEDAFLSGADFSNPGDLIEITFEGGAAGTQMHSLTIDLDPNAGGLEAGDRIFDTLAGGLGSSGAVPLTIVENNGIDSINFSLSSNDLDGQTSLTITFSGFDVGDSFTIGVDIDEVAEGGGLTPTVEGAEFEGSTLTATFSADTYYDSTKTATFYNQFSLDGTGLQLPPDDYIPPNSVPAPDYTAGAIGELQQVPLPITISGTVFEDGNLNNHQDGGEQGIGGVELELWQWNGSQYESTGRVTTTDSQGDYHFDDVDPGRYRVVEHQPDGYHSVGAEIGSVDGSPRGSVFSPDILTDIQLVGGDDTIENNFAEAAANSIEGVVYHDRDNDGFQDVGEEGIAGAEVQLFDQQGNLVATTFTNAQGEYLFDDLHFGSYSLQEIQPAGYLDGLDTAGSVGGLAENPGDAIRQIQLTSGTHATDYLFGELVPASISGQVFADLDGDCYFDPEESPIEGVEIHLRDVQGNIVATTQTDAQGLYQFDNLRPGEYTVHEVQPFGYYQGGVVVGSAGGVISTFEQDTVTSIALVSGENAAGYTFCEVPPATLAGNVYVDANQNGVRDGGEQGIGGVTLELRDAGGSVVATTATDSTGAYLFDSILPGEYSVHEVQPFGYFDGEESIGTAGGVLGPGNDVISQVTLHPAEHATEYNFGELLPASIQGSVFADLDGDCIQDPGESPLENVVIQLLNGNGDVIDSTVTDANGDYSFESLPPGTYGIREIQPTGYFQGGTVVGSAGGTLAPGDADTIVAIELHSGEAATEYVFCEHPPAQLSGEVYVDQNQSGTLDSGERGIGGVTLELLDVNGQVVATTVTNDAGHYLFDQLPPGTYSIREIQPAGYFDGIDQAGSLGGIAQNPGDQISQIVLGPGMQGVEYRFGEYEPASLHGRVFADLDGDCILDANETPIAGVQIELLDGTGQVIATTTTDAGGDYSFEGLPPGTYGVREIQPAGYYQGGTMVGTAGGTLSSGDSDTIVAIELGSGTVATEYVFCEHPPSKLAGSVYVDANQNGNFDSGETGIAGVELELYNSNGDLVATVVTDETGFYCFENLPPDTYTIEEVQPPGYYDGVDTPGTLGGIPENPGDSIRGIALPPGTTGEEYVFGEVLAGRISGRVHADLDGDCIFDPEESPLVGVEIELLDDAGQVVATTFTNDAGEYLFDNLPPGTYSVREIQPAGFFDGMASVGSGTGTVTDSNTIAAISIGSGQTLVDYDFCEEPHASLSGRVYQDGPNIVLSAGTTIDLSNTRDGILSADDTPIAGVTLILGDTNGNPILDASGNLITTVTGSDGSFRFDALHAGSYSLLQVQPDDYVDNRDHAGDAGGTAVNPGDAILGIELKTGQQASLYHFSELKVETPPGLIIRPPLDPLPSLGGPVLVGAPPAPAPIIVAPPVVSVNRVDLGAGLGVGNAGDGYTWHLSVIDGGFPRGNVSTASADNVIRPVYFSPETWEGPDMTESLWQLPSGTDALIVDRSFAFGPLEGIPVTGDFNGDGVTDIGIFVDGEWFIDANGNGRWDEGDMWAKLGKPGDRPVVGDWNGDGKSDIGVYGLPWEGDDRALAAEVGLPSAENPPIGVQKNVPPRQDEAPVTPRLLKHTAAGEVRADLIDHVFAYGQAGDIPLSGDWNGDGMDKVGVYRNGIWYLDVDGDGQFTATDEVVHLGEDVGLPIVGDFDGDGVDELGLYQEGVWKIDTNGDHQLDALDKVFELGGPESLPIVGDFDGDGIEEVGLYRPGAGYDANSEAAQDHDVAQRESSRKRI